MERILEYELECNDYLFWPFSVENVIETSDVTNYNLKQYSNITQQLNRANIVQMNIFSLFNHTLTFKKKILVCYIYIKDIWHFNSHTIQMAKCFFQISKLIFISARYISSQRVVIISLYLKIHFNIRKNNPRTKPHFLAQINHQNFFRIPNDAK